MKRPKNITLINDSNLKIDELKRKLKEEQNNNKMLHEIINKLKKENKEIKKNSENEIEKLKQTIKKNSEDKKKKLRQTIKKLEKEINDKNNEIQNYILEIKNLNEKNNQIIKSETKEQNFKLFFNTQENQDIQNYEISCNNTDLFVRLEEKLYNEFPKYRNYQTYFKNNSSTILRFKTLEENQIQNNSKIFLLIDENK